MRMLNEAYQKEIRLKDLLMNMLINWRKFICFSLIFMVLLGSYRFYVLVQANSSTDYNAKLEEYNRKILNAKSEVSKLEVEMDNICEYNKNSIKMQIDPYNMFKASKSYYVDTNYKIMPELTYQNTNKTNSVIQAYMMISGSDDLYTYIKDNLSYDIDIRYLKEIISLSELDDNMFNISVIHNDKKLCEDIFNLIIAYIEHYKSTVEKSICEHNLVGFENTITSIVDLSISEYQKNNIQYLLDSEKKLSESKATLAAMIPPQKISLRSVLKYSILGLIIGAFLISGILTYIYVESDKIQDIQDFKRRYKLLFMGIVCYNKKKRLFYRIDKAIRRMTNNYQNDKNEGLDWIAAYLGNYVESNSVKNIFLTGTIDTKLLSEIYIELKDKSYLSALSMNYGANVSYNTDTIIQLKGCNDIVIIEKIDKSLNSEIIKQLEYLEQLGKNIIGVVLVN